MEAKVESRGIKKERDLDNLLKLIEEGDPASILSEENISKGFNQLMSYEMILLEEGKVHLTALGKEARKNGVKAVILREKQKAAAIAPQPLAPVRKPVFIPGRKNMWILILLFLSTLLILAFFNLLQQ